ncbi:MAG: hypothetical protein LV480_00745 [Methylacidiphilales bacterium]|nr:hypothetical protein [Candidatus Methylacidiphilales bacterium]
MNLLRRIHLYLGCFFAPMLVFFSISGIWQVYGLQWGDNAKILKLLSTIHMGHNMGFKEPHPFTLTSPYLEFFVALMAVSLVLSVLLGVIMAFKFGRGTLALACVAGGILVPLILILLFAHNV